MRNLAPSFGSSRLKSAKGFTLVDVLLYVGFAAILFTGISVTLMELIAARVKSETIAEVEQQGQQVMQLITQFVRNAQSITSPATGNSASNLTLVTDSGTATFGLSGNTIRITENGGAAEATTSSQLIASNLAFKNLTRTGTPGSVRVSFNLTHSNPSGRNEYSFTGHFVSSASLRYP